MRIRVLPRCESRRPGSLDFSMPSTRSLRFLAAVAIAMGSCCAFPAAAQDGAAPPAQLAPPVPGKPDEPPVIMNYLTMLIILAAAVGANMIPSKRGHQD